tara:strand:+ start:4459 stop:6159 length:1701 start_codon:yes stop_codon:yes gene_type:complete
MSIEILENTLIKLLVRRGTNNDRKNITLESGELGFTTDTQNLFIGDGSTKGGLIVGNKFKGTNADVTNLAPCLTGDYGFETSTNTLKVLVGGSGSNATDWLEVSNLLSSRDGTIEINDQNQITVSVLSSGNLSPDCLGKSLQLVADQVSLSSDIEIDVIRRATTESDSYLSLPTQLKISNINYNFPGVAPSNNSFLGSDTSGNLNWSVPSIISTGVAPTTASVLPVGTIVPFASASNGVPYGWLECDGAEYASNSEYSDLSAVIGTDYNTGGETADHFRVPNLLSKALYGVPNGVPASSTVYPVTTGSHTAPSLSATGMNFLIKAIGGITAPTLTISKNLSATLTNPAGTASVSKTGVTFNPLSGSITIERPAPGQEVFTNAGDTVFTVPDGIHYIKYTVTGTGTKGAASPGGAGATAMGYLSASPGITFTVTVGEGFQQTDAPTNGRASSIKIGTGAGATAIVTADGGIYEGGNGQSAAEGNNRQTPSATAGGTIDTSSPYILNGHVINGGSGLQDTSGGKGKEESLGAASYFGTSPAPGGGQASHSTNPIGPPPSNGIVILEWS